MSIVIQRGVAGSVSVRSDVQRTMEVSRLGGIVALALLVRIAAFIGQGPAAMDWDGANFIRTAQNLLAGHGYIGIRGTINVVHAPLYPLFIAAVTLLTHDAERSALIISLIAGAVFPAIVYVVAKRAFGERTGLVAAVIAAVHPVLVWLSLQLVADQLAFALEFAGLACLLRWLDDRRTRDLALTGTLFGLSCLARAEAVLDLAVALAVVLLVRRPSWRVAVPLLCLIVPFVACVAPYAVFLTRVTGHVAWEAKSPVNYAIGVRIQRGMSYVEAADGLGPDGSEAGAELGDGYFYTHRNDPAPSFAERVRFASRAIPAHVVEIARTLLSRHYGTPLFVAFVLFGVLRGLRSPRAAACAVLLASVAGKGIALATVAHFWPRYAAPFVPYMVVFGAAGMVGAATWIATRAPSVARPSVRWVWAALSLVLCVAVVGTTLRDVRAEAEDSRPLAAAGSWIARNEPAARTIVAVTPLTAYYAGISWNALPWASSTDAARYVARKPVDLIVLEPRDADRPYLAAWRAHGVPLPNAHLVYRSPGDPATAIQVYGLRH